MNLLSERVAASVVVAQGNNGKSGRRFIRAKNEPNGARTESVRQHIDGHRLAIAEHPPELVAVRHVAILVDSLGRRERRRADVRVAFAIEDYGSVVDVRLERNILIDLVKLFAMRQLHPLAVRGADERPAVTTAVTAVFVAAFLATILAVAFSAALLSDERSDLRSQLGVGDGKSN